MKSTRLTLGTVISGLVLTVILYFFTVNFLLKRGLTEPTHTYIESLSRRTTMGFELIVDRWLHVVAGVYGLGCCITSTSCRLRALLPPRPTAPPQKPQRSGDGK